MGSSACASRLSTRRSQNIGAARDVVPRLIEAVERDVQDRLAVALDERDTVGFLEPPASPSPTPLTPIETSMRRRSPSLDDGRWHTRHLSPRQNRVPEEQPSQLHLRGRGRVVGRCADFFGSARLAGCAPLMSVDRTTPARMTARETAAATLYRRWWFPSPAGSHNAAKSVHDKNVAAWAEPAPAVVGAAWWLTHLSRGMGRMRANGHAPA